jgi:hypothetical protein
MWNRLFDLLPIGCRHRHMSLPFSANSSKQKTSAESSWETISERKSNPYVDCLDCGKHFDYDWASMRVVK